MQGVVSIDKLLKVTIHNDGEKTTLTANLGGDSKSTPLTALERRQIFFIITRTGVVQLDEAEDLITDSEVLTGTIQNQANAIEELRNQLSAANGSVEQFKAANATLEAAEFERKQQAEGGEETIEQLRTIISGLQTKVDDSTKKIEELVKENADLLYIRKLDIEKNNLVIEGGVATVASVEDATEKSDYEPTGKVPEKESKEK